MNQISLSRLQQTCLTLMVAMFAALWAVPSSAQSMRKVGVDELMSASDYVFIATCTKKDVSFKNGNIVSHYQLKPSKVIKGKLKMDAKTGEVALEELGGELTKPLPIAQMLPGMANLAEGQEVLLFSASPRVNTNEPLLVNKQRSLSLDTLRIVGGVRGYYTVIRHPETGVKLVKKGSLLNPPGLNGEPVLHLTRKIEAERERALALVGLDKATTEDELLRAVSAQGKATERIDKIADRIGANIDRQALEARSRRDQKALTDATCTNDIYEYESLDSVLMRLERLASQAENEK